MFAIGSDVSGVGEVRYHPIQLTGEKHLSWSLPREPQCESSLWKREGSCWEDSVQGDRKEEEGVVTLEHSHVPWVTW